MVNTDAILGIKLAYIFAWAFIATYYFIWGASEAADAIDYGDESGWVPDGAFARSMTAQVAHDPLLEE
ncbi:hypothetical protein KPH14_008399 [Odynerus spinipes]|uniref:Uncharacterized protein n=1 Tax=Odynerus spinipes TaxID=1348599 RepID=A0AAD9RAJ7_9HYME|nr:hypothetical protein KPH14_008399 [Odynerus spinipes]